MKIPDEVACTITNCKHAVVNGNKNYKKLHKWAKDALYRMDFDQKVIIALDCEGYCLGSRPNSLGLIQFAECFTSDFFNQERIPNPTSIALKNGFLVKAPFTKGVKKLLSTVFSHPNIYIVTFDFTSDLTAILEAGININKRNIVDGQALQYFEDGTKYFGRKVAKSLKTACQSATNCVEFEKAKYAIGHKDTVPFSKLAYDLQNEKDPFSCMCTEDFWRYSSDDIALTAIALVSGLKYITPEQILLNSKKKVEGYMELVNGEENGIKAVLKRQFSFVPRIGLEYDNVKYYYDLWLSITNILNNYDMYKSIVKEEKQYDRAYLESQKTRAINQIKAKEKPKEKVDILSILNKKNAQKNSKKLIITFPSKSQASFNKSDYNQRRIRQKQLAKISNRNEGFLISTNPGSECLIRVH